MKILDIIQSNWFYYGIVFFMSIAIASIKFFSNFWYNFLAFVIFLSLEILVCSFWDIPIVAPIVLAVLVFMFFAIKDFRPTSKNNNSIIMLIFWYMAVLDLEKQNQSASGYYRNIFDWVLPDLSMTSRI